MKLNLSTKIEGVFEYIPRVFSDERGYFKESFNREKLQALLSDHGLGLLPKFVQENHSYSRMGVLRGLHFQKGYYAQGKLVSVVTGSVNDVAVDLRPNSPTYLNWERFFLNGRQYVYLPPGIAHGFYATADTIFQYKCTKPYHKESEGGIRYDDPVLGIEWGYELDPVDPIVSEKDQALPSLAEAGFALPNA